MVNRLTSFYLALPRAASTAWASFAIQILFSSFAAARQASTSERLAPRRARWRLRSLVDASVRRGFSIIAEQPLAGYLKA
ncbi:uncharacterized protein N7515_008278 [Penicillium bovifimosum]|uniref:Uncharacterized protein n=1 Tax=Penicillium bovifimosum TaxID=126998 RepID=A0A9W9GMZ1_9EURO|nr:uncharacterized protein N7515_008278 [Penicillium bovifimosum]KAJ5124453.1 hypothetical protein N7515_008278 [Penicillium bovifimosum]